MCILITNINLYLYISIYNINKTIDVLITLFYLYLNNASCISEKQYMLNITYKNSNIIFTHD